MGINPLTVRRLQARIAATIRSAPLSTIRSKPALGFRAIGPALGLPTGPASAAVTRDRSGGGRGTDPDTDERPVEPLGKNEPGRGIAWVSVRSSWILALRFVPTGRQGNQKYADGYVDMMVKYQRRCYRYGPVQGGQRSFNTWRVAASRGKYWWRYWTRKWSPARRIA